MASVFPGRASLEYAKFFASFFKIIVCPGRNSARRPVSRVLSAPCGGGRPFLWDAHCCAPHATNPGDGAGMRLVPWFPMNRPPLFGLAPGGVYPAATVAGRAVRSCRPVSPLPSAHGFPCASGGLFSVALSLGSPPPAVSRHRIPMEPGLSSPSLREAAVVQPSGLPCVRAPGRIVNWWMVFRPARSRQNTPVHTGALGRWR